LQEISTLKLLSCFVKDSHEKKFCNKDAKKEIIPNLIRRLILPFYIPVVSLLCSFLLIKNNINLLERMTIYLFTFLLIVLTELFIRYTGINYQIRSIYIILPFALIMSTYLILNYKLKKFNKIYE